MNENYNSGYLL